MPRKKGSGFTASEYAKHRGCSQPAVIQAIQSGRLSRSLNEQNRIISFELADKEWEENTDPMERMRAMGDAAYEVEDDGPSRSEIDDATMPSPNDLSDNQDGEDLDSDPAARSKNPAIRVKHWQAEIARLKFREAAGELVPASQVEAKLSKYIHACRAKLLALPSRAKQAMPHLELSDVATLEDLVGEALEDLIVSEDAKAKTG